MFFQWMSKTAYRVKKISVENKIKHCHHNKPVGSIKCKTNLKVLAMLFSNECLRHWDNLQTKNHLSWKQNQTLPPTISLEHYLLRSWVCFCHQYLKPSSKKLFLRTTTKMWHFSYLKQNNHRNQRLLLNLVTGNNWVYLSKRSRYNWRFQFPHSTSTTLAT